MSTAVTKSWACDGPSFCNGRLGNCRSLDLMIARIWRGWTNRQDARAYEEMLRDEIFPGIARRNIKGYHGAELFIREDGDEVEFATLLRFDSMEGVKEFAGENQSKPVIYRKAESLLARMDEQSRHYQIVISL